MFRMTSRRTGLGVIGVVAALLGVAACDPFSVSDPSRYTDEAVDQAPQAVVNGVEGGFQLALDDYVIASALLGDEWQHTGTWAGYDEFDHGRARYANSGQSDGPYNAWLRARFASQDAQLRFTRLGFADTSPEVVAVKSIEAMIDLYLGEGWCEAPAEAGGPAVSDGEMYQQAIAKLTAAMGLAQTAGLTTWVDVNRAGLARANLLAGNFNIAAGHAQQIADGFSYVAKFSEAASSNSIVNLNTVGFNKAAGVREKWWPSVDTIAGFFKDPWTGALDRRLPIVHRPKDLGVDANTPFYSQFKYTSLDAPIPVIKWQEMRLIEAEADYRNGLLDAAVGKLNALRARAGVGLNALPPHGGSANTVRDYLLHERFAELFLEGHRLPDLYRFNLIPTTVIEVGKASTGRLMKFPLSISEAVNNTNLEDNAAVRCAPVS